MELTPAPPPIPLISPPATAAADWYTWCCWPCSPDSESSCYQGLTSASVYFYNADEAVAQRADLGDKRFRLQGTVIGDSIRPTDAGVDFTVAYDSVLVQVRHQGDPPELFQAGIPVVLDGRWDPSRRRLRQRHHPRQALRAVPRRERRSPRRG